MKFSFWLCEIRRSQLTGSSSRDTICYDVVSISRPPRHFSASECRANSQDEIRRDGQQNPSIFRGYVPCFSRHFVTDRVSRTKRIHSRERFEKERKTGKKGVYTTLAFVRLCLSTVFRQVKTSRRPADDETRLRRSSSTSPSFPYVTLFTWEKRGKSRP